MKHKVYQVGRNVRFLLLFLVVCGGCGCCGCCEEGLISRKFDSCKQVLEKKNFKIIRTKTEYLTIC